MDGDVIVKQYAQLSINLGHTMTVSQRCKGLVIYVDGDCRIDGKLSMSARGANANPTLENSIAPTGIRLARRKKDATDTLIGSDVGGTGEGGVGNSWRFVESLQPSIVRNGKIYTIARSGGAGGDSFTGHFGVHLPGGRKEDGTGGGGSGAAGDMDSYVGGGGEGTCYSGGSGGGGAQSGGDGGIASDAGLFGGSGGNGGSVGGSIYMFGGGGGGAGNPGGPAGNAPDPYGELKKAGDGGQGTGGLLVLCVRGNLLLGPKSKISANGLDGGPGGYNAGQHAGGGGGSGGGRIVILHAGKFDSAGVIEAAGGKGGSGLKDYSGGMERTAMLRLTRSTLDTADVTMRVVCPGSLLQ